MPQLSPTSALLLTGAVLSPPTPAAPGFAPALTALLAAAGPEAALPAEGRQTAAGAGKDLPAGEIAAETEGGDAPDLEDSEAAAAAALAWLGLPIPPLPNAAKPIAATVEPAFAPEQLAFTAGPILFFAAPDQAATDTPVSPAIPAKADAAVGRPSATEPQAAVPTARPPASPRPSPLLPVADGPAAPAAVVDAGVAPTATAPLRLSLRRAVTAPAPAPAKSASSGASAAAPAVETNAVAARAEAGNAPMRAGRAPVAPAPKVSPDIEVAVPASAGTILLSEALAPFRRAAPRDPAANIAVVPLAPEGLRPAHAGAAEAPEQPALDTTRHDWIEAMAEQIDALRETPNSRETGIRLSPDALGTVDISISHEGDRVEVRITAENPAARALLAEAQPKLLELAEARGLRLGQSSVDSGGAGHGQRHETAPQAQQLPSAPRRARAEADTTDQRIA